MKKVIVVTVRSPKGAELNFETVAEKLDVVKSNVKKMGYRIVKVA